MYAVLFAVLAMMMAVFALFVRMKSMKKPATAKKILIPPLAMSTGFLMFLYPPVQEITWLEMAEAFIVGLLFSILLIKTSSFEIRDNNVYMKRSKMLPIILVGLLAVRLLFKLTFGIYFEYEVLAGMFFILAFGMLLPWRIAMFLKFKEVEKELYEQNHLDKNSVTLKNA
ncbi:CcdC family protein [Alkalicoccus daliensis]|uniref:Membrane protein CcdC involved in cytochrome C biogenesis n=1 Tax=Alkalicoccus daliensis TaxID=745820 RepID=A0A1H0ACC4_9BACI|nr:cytochrome c biogenesis protein CcdC [Alkalicoccus daliensis]SDN31135.1 Membrane protein CcdC involved in cytochrome C biogenesis [Alkalicoccus daliensis]